MTKTATYKLRAECLPDVIELWKATAGQIEDLTIKFAEFPQSDIEATFTTTKTHSELLDTLQAIPDGHVMHQTLELADEYTGERVDR